MENILENKKTYRALIFTIITTLILTLISPVFSSKVSANTINLSLEEAQLAEDMEFLFTKATTLVDGKYIINEEILTDKFGADSVPSISAFIKMVNGEELQYEDVVNIPNVENMNASKGISLMAAKDKSWKECFGDEILDATGIGFISGALWELIERDAWDMVAKELAKIVGKNALKGGIIGFTASLAWFAIKCK